MSANDRSFEATIAEAKALLEGHDDAEYEALAASQKANYQEALEFLRRLESETGSGDGRSAVGSESSTDADTETTPEHEAPEIEIDSDLESTMGDDGERVGPFGGDDVVVYDPDDEGGWLSMDYDVTVPIERMR
ncbi:MAG: hypothetical protein QXG03_03565 [Halalkalicoccus sp.]